MKQKSASGGAEIPASKEGVTPLSSNPATKATIDYKGLYEKQVKNQSWYQSGYFAVILSILLPFAAPLIGYLWYRNRKNETYQKITISEATLSNIRINRRTLKQTANIKQYLKKEDGVNNTSSKMIDLYMHRSKRDRYGFFEKPQQVNPDAVKRYQESKAETIKHISSFKN